MLCAVLPLASCEDMLGNGDDTEQDGNKPDEGEGNGKEAPLTLRVDAKTATTAVFAGVADIDKMTDYSEFGFIWSLDEVFSAENDHPVRVSELFDVNKYSKTVTGLPYGTTIYYTTYLCKAGVYVYGATNSFTTDDITVDLSATVKQVTTVAQFDGTVTGLSDEDKSAVEVGVAYSASSYDLKSESSTKIAATEIGANGAFSVKSADLSWDTKYYYCHYVKSSGSYEWGDVKELQMVYPYAFQSELNMASAADLSSDTSANCYVISESGLYKFKTVKGNSTTSVVSVTSAEILWESFGTSTAPEMLDLIKAFCYKDGYIAFQTADTFKEGNAVIAAKDASGNILWSWHIWLTDQPQAQVYNNNAGTMMDRNLGATSATPGDVGALGLLYQWGRKDPFLGSSSISSSTLAKSTITWPSKVSSNSSNGTIEYATAHPTTFITYNSSNYDWYYTGSSSTDNTRWTTSSSAKSIYDPCPAGWRVPDGGSSGVWSMALGSSSSFNNSSLYNDTNEGMNFSGKFGSASTIWYPASGCRDHNGGSLSHGGDDGSYWSASPGSDFACYLYFDYDGHVNPSYSNYRASGYSVRCLQESK